MMPQLLYYDLDPHVTAFSTTRHGGCSEGNYAQLNINAYCGDQAEAIEENRQMLCRHIAVESPERLVIPHQVHGTVVRKIEGSFFQLAPHERQQLLEGVDAVATNVKDICIGVSTADCIPILIYDPEHHCAAAVHAGWRGTVARIAQQAVRFLTQEYHCRASQLHASIGPGISLQNFEVGQEVYDHFHDAGFPMEQIADHLTWPKPHIDLPLCNRLQLQEQGVPNENIFDCAICTYDHADDYFSARRLGIQSGRIFTGIVLR